MSILSERTPLGAQDATNSGEQQAQTYYMDNQYYDEDGFSIYSEGTIKRQKLMKVISITIGVILVIPITYFILIYLPSLAPEGTDIPIIVKVGNTNSFLHPLIPAPSLYEEDTNMEPFMTGGIPHFSKYQYLDTKSKLFKKFFKDSIISPDKQNSKKRYMLIGDVHGSLRQLKQLLGKLGYDNGKNDHVIMLGDFLDKGPDSVGVLDYAIEHNLDCVLGNHEIEILKRYIQFHALPPLAIKHSDDSEDSAVTIIKPNESYDFDEMMKIAKKLYPVHIDYLSKCNIIKTLGPVPHFTDRSQNSPAKYPALGVAVHGGLQWSIAELEDQDPYVVINIRSLLGPDFTVPVDDRHIDGAESWSKHWTLNERKNYKKELKEIAKSKPDGLVTIGTKVYYGHDAGRGLLYREYSSGLDTGCVYGDELTAEIIWSEVKEDDIVYKRTSAHIDCS